MSMKDALFMTILFFCENSNIFVCVSVYVKIYTCIYMCVCVFQMLVFKSAGFMMDFGNDPVV